METAKRARSKPLVTVERLRELLSYDPETGIFTWRVPRGGRCKVGEVAGTVRERGYVNVCLDGALYRAHRLAWLYVYGTWPAGEVDHINGVTGDNRIGNLRDLPADVNCQNRASMSNNKSGYTGVEVRETARGTRFRGYMSVGKRQVKLGTFDTAEEAAAQVQACKYLALPGWVLR